MTALAASDPVVAHRSRADRRMRRVLRLPVDAPPASLMGAHNAFSRSIFISATRCLLSYVVIPVIGPLVGLSGAVGPWLGITLSLVSLVALWFAARRFFAADHKWRWIYAGVAALIAVFVVVQGAIDVGSLIT